MGVSVLIIDAEEEFAGQLADALRQHGADVQITSDGKAGLDAARINIPDAIVLCVELPRMSGYSICAKLKKDPTLKGVPLVITSAEATQETFDHHKKLKTRAEEYLKKPFETAILVEALGRHVSMGGGDEASEAADILPDVNIAEELAIDAEAPQTITDQEAFGSDGPFAGLQQPVAPPPLPSDTGGLDSAVGLIDDPELEDLDDEARTMVGTMPIMAQVSTLEAQIRDLEAALAQATAERDEARSTVPVAASQVPTPASGREVLALKKELNQKERDILELKDELQSKSKELLGARDEQMELESKVLQAQEETQTVSAARDSLQSELDSTKGDLQKAQEGLRNAEGSLTEARSALEAAEARASEQALAQDARIQALEEELESTKGRAQGLEEEVEAKATRVLELEQQVEGQTAEVARISGELEEKGSEIDSLNGQTRALGSEVTRLGNELSAATAESDTLRAQVASAQSEISALEERAQSLDTERESAVMALEEARSSLSSMQQDLEVAGAREARGQEIRAKAKQALQIAAALLADDGEPELDGETEDALDEIPMEEPELEVDAAQIEGEELSL